LACNTVKFEQQNYILCGSCLATSLNLGNLALWFCLLEITFNYLLLALFPWKVECRCYETLFCFLQIFFQDSFSCWHLNKWIYSIGLHSSQVWSANNILCSSCLSTVQLNIGYVILIVLLQVNCFFFHGKVLLFHGKWSVNVKIRFSFFLKVSLKKNYCVVFNI
jgi:hypothetical protein